jgi:hypothetical protein
VLIQLGYHPWVIEGVMALIDQMPARQGLNFSACLKDCIKNSSVSALNANVCVLADKSQLSNARWAKTIKKRTVDCLTRCFSGNLSMERAITMTRTLSDSLAATLLDNGTVISEQRDGFFAKRQRFVRSASLERIAMLAF